MKKRFGLLSAILVSAFAGVQVHAEMIYVAKGAKNSAIASGERTSYATERPFYVAAYYNYSMWTKVIDRPLLFDGDNTNSFDAVVGYRVFDWMRIEASYYRPDYQLAGKRLSIEGHAITANAIFDARISHLYSFVSKQWFVPYVGAGFGLSFNKVNSDISFRETQLDNKSPLVFNIMAGISIEFNKSFAVDFGYKYFYMAAPHLSMNVDFTNYELDDFSPTAHQVRAGVRISF